MVSQKIESKIMEKRLHGAFMEKKNITTRARRALICFRHALQHKRVGKDETHPHAKNSRQRLSQIYIHECLPA
jgi:hypothetical protein